MSRLRNKRMHNFLTKFDQNLTKVESVLAGSLVLIATMIGFLQIILRYVFQAGLIWANEVVTMLVVFGVFIGISTAAGQDKHIRFDIVVNCLPSTQRLLNRFFTNLLSLSFAICMLIFGIKYLIFLSIFGGRSSASGIPSIYPFSIIAISGMFLSIRYIVKLMELYRLFRRLYH